MDSQKAFEQFSRAIDSDPLDVLLAKWRRDRFVSELLRMPGVQAVIESGSLARETTVGPIHDIDLIVILDRHDARGSDRSLQPPNEALADLRDLLDATGLSSEPK